MSVLVLLLIRGQHRRQLLLTAGCAGVVAVLLLFAVMVVDLPDEVEEYLFPLLRDPGLRPGVILALLLMVAPVLLLLYQFLRLGTNARNRRFAVLRTAGATPVQVRLLSVAGLVLPAGLGALTLGPAGLWLLRLLFGGRVVDDATGSAPLRVATGLIPTSVTPSVGQVLLVALGVALLCGLIGWRVSREVLAEPYGVMRRSAARAPRAWPLLLVVAAFVATTPLLENTIAVVCGVGLCAVGLLLSGPWIAARAGRRTASRAETAAALLAGSRVTADPWAAGRAVAPIAVLGLVGAGAVAILVDVTVYGGLGGFFAVSLGLVTLALLFVLTFVVFSLAAHSVETLTGHRRSTAALAAAGVPLAELTRSLVAEARLLARPAAALGVLTGTAAIMVVTYPYGAGDSTLLALLPIGLAAYVIMLGLTELAAYAAARLVHPWLLAATHPDALRTE